MAKLKAIITKEDHDQLSDALKDFYVEKDGKFILDSDHEDVTGLKNTVAALRKERSDAEAALAKYKEVGDVDKARDALKKVQELEEAEARKAGEWDKLKTQLIEKNATEKAELNQRLKDMEKDVESLVVDREIATVLSDPEVGGKVRALTPHMKVRIKAVKEGGQWKPIVHDGQGNPVVADGKGTPMTPKDLAMEMRKDPEFADLFKSNSRSGSGTPPGGAAAGGNGNSSVAKKGDTESLSKNFADIASGKVTVTD